MAKLAPAPIQPNIGRASLPRAPRPGLRKKPWRKYGSRIYRLDKEPEGFDGPGVSPEGFVTGKSSESEWYLYWAMWKVTKMQGDVRVGPFEGDHGGIWAYQRYFPILGVTGKTNVDFVYYGGGFWIGIRSQSERFHLMMGTGQVSLDNYLYGHNPGLDVIVNVYEADFLTDKTGSAACRVMADAIKGIESQGSLRKGNTFRILREDP